MSFIFLEIVMISDDLHNAGFRGRDEIEDPLEESLSDSGFGEVTGGGGGSGKVIIDVEIDPDYPLEESLSFIRNILKGLNVPGSTVIKRHQPKEEIFPVY